jgi:hypothetical protein
MSTADPADFIALAHRIVWCSLATVDARGRPRSRLVHPVWELTPAGPVARVATRATAVKRAHLAHSPFASCSYWDPAHDVAVAECAAAWDPDPAGAWPAFAAPPPPVGFDPATVFGGGLDDPAAAVIVLRPWRLRWGRAADLAAGRPHAVWRPAA